MATPITIPAGRAMQNYASSALSDMQNDHQQQRPTRASCVTLKHINEDSPLVTPVRTTTRIAPATAATAPIAVADGLASSATTAAHQQIAAAAAMSTATPVTATTPGRRRQRRRTRASESCTAEFRDEYEFVGGQDGFLGEGAYAVVRTARHRRTGKEYAVKVIDKRDRHNTRNKVLNEARLFRSCENCQNIVHFHDFKEDDNSYYMVFELLQGGNLQSHLDARKERQQAQAAQGLAVEDTVFDEYEVAHIVRDLAKALDFMHNKRVVHRDLKMANVLCENKEFPSPCKLADFDLATAEKHIPADNQSPGADTSANFDDCRRSNGSNIDSCLGMSPPPPTGAGSWCDTKLANKFADYNLSAMQDRNIIEPPIDMKSFVGSPEYMAPEIVYMFLKGYLEEDDQDLMTDLDYYYTQACDIWSLGITAYVAIAGKAPFQAIRDHCNNGDSCYWEQGGQCHDCQDSLFRVIYEGDLEFPDAVWKNVDKDLIDLIKRCLDRDDIHRFSAFEILEHPFIQRLESGDLNRAYRARQKSQRAMLGESDHDSAADSSTSHSNSGTSSLNLEFKSCSLSLEPEMAYTASPLHAGPTVQHNSHLYPNHHRQQGPLAPVAAQPWQIPPMAHPPLHAAHQPPPGSINIGIGAPAAHHRGLQSAKASSPLDENNDSGHGCDAQFMSYDGVPPPVFMPPGLASALAVAPTTRNPPTPAVVASGRLSAGSIAIPATRQLATPLPMSYDVGSPPPAVQRPLPGHPPVQQQAQTRQKTRAMPAVPHAGFLRVE